jgi:hypothetical protein
MEAGAASIAAPEADGSRVVAEQQPRKSLTPASRLREAIFRSSPMLTARPVGIFRRCSVGATACMVHRLHLCIEGMTNVGLILLLILLVLVFGGGGFYLGPPFHLFGGGLGLLLVIVIIVLLVRG